MRLFLLLISTLVITVTLVLMGTSNTQLSGHLSQSITNMKGVSWQRLQGGELVDHDDHEFQANNVYTTRLGDDLLTTTWSTNEPLTSPMTYEGDYSFIMQAYSGYLFQSFDPLASYSLEGDYYEVFIDGA